MFRLKGGRGWGLAGNSYRARGCGGLGGALKNGAK